MNPTTIYLINRILDMFNLVWTPGRGLEYYQVINYGRISILVTKDFDEVLKFLGIPTIKTNEIRTLFEILKHSKYFNKNQFFRRPLENNDYMTFIFYLKTDKPIDQFKPTITTRQIAIEGFDIGKKLQKLHSNGFNQSSLRNKFNGKLIMKWTGISPGPELAITIQKFKQHIESTFNKQFLEYLATRTPRQVRTDFITYNQDCTLTEKLQKLPY